MLHKKNYGEKVLKVFPWDWLLYTYLSFCYGNDMGVLCCIRKTMGRRYSKFSLGTGCCILTFLFVWE